MFVIARHITFTLRVYDLTYTQGGGCMSATAAAQETAVHHCELRFNICKHGTTAFWDIF